MLKSYWQNYYKKDNGITAPSDFAVFCYENFISKEPNGELIDVGCGNLRDTEYFLNNDISVISIDQTYCPQQRIISKRFIHMKASVDILPLLKFKHCYMRWLLHSLDIHEQRELFSWLRKNSPPGNKIYIECRSNKDKLIDDSSHTRRLIDSEQLIRLVCTNGFKIAYMEEGRNFSKIQEDNPLLIRLVGIRV